MSDEGDGLETTPDEEEKELGWQRQPIVAVLGHVDMARQVFQIILDHLAVKGKQV